MYLFLLFLLVIDLFVITTVTIGSKISIKSSFTLSHIFSCSFIKGNSVNAERVDSLYLKISNSSILNVFVTSSAENVLAKDSTTDFKISRNVASTYWSILTRDFLLFGSDFRFVSVLLFDLLFTVLFFLYHNIHGYGHHHLKKKKSRYFQIQIH